MTIRANTRRHIAFDLLADAFALGLLVASIKVGNDTLKVGGITACVTMLRRVANCQRIRCAIQHFLALVLGQVTPGSMQAEVVLLRQSFQDRCMPLAAINNLAPRRYRPLEQAQFRMGHNQFRIDLLLCAKPRTGGTRAMWAVKAKGTWSDLRQADTAVDASKLL